MTSLVVTGFYRHARYLARLLNTNLHDVRAMAYDECSRPSLLRAAAHALVAQASITIGGEEPKAAVRAICEARRRPAIHVWAGSDVLTMSQSPARVETVRLLNLVHWCVAPHLATELAALGIQARYVLVASAPVPQTIAPMPADFTVLTYLPEPRRKFYGQDGVWDAARAFPHARFIVVGPGGAEPGAPANVHYVGEQADMDARIDAACVFLRLPQHDGLSLGVIEALARGRHVIWNYQLPGVTTVQSTDEAIAQLGRLNDAHRSGALAINHAGIAYAAAYHNPRSVAEGISDEIADAIASAGRAHDADCAQRRIAVSGLPVFSTRVAANCRAYGNGFAPSVLRTDTRSETAVSLLTLLKSKAWYSIGQPCPRGLELAAYAARKRRIVHWFGNDVAALNAHPRLARRYRSARFVHLAQDADVARKLDTLGLCATVACVPALPRIDVIRPLPERFTVLLYLPADRPEIYGRHQYERLMRALTGEAVQYIIVGGGTIAVPSGVRAEQIGWRHDLSDIYERSSVLARFTQTDSFSAMVVEALLHGRHVLWSNDFPYVTRLANFHDLEKNVRSLLQLHESGRLTPTYDAAFAMRTQYSPDECLRRIEAAFERP
jgi:hypothetical protein